MPMRSLGRVLPAGRSGAPVSSGSGHRLPDDRQFLATRHAPHVVFQHVVHAPGLLVVGTFDAHMQALGFGPADVTSACAAGDPARSRPRSRSR